MTITTEITLNDQEKVQLSEILKCKVETLESELSLYSSAALEEYSRMILGQKVFTRVQDIKEYRLYLLIKKVFSNRIPDDQQISDLFQSTPSESRSLVRSITSKYQYELQAAIQETLKEILEKSIPDTFDENNYLISINSSTKIEELNNILASLDGTLPPIVKKRGTVSSYIIKASSYSKLKEKLGTEHE